LSDILKRLNKLIDEEDDFSDIINGFENFSICDSLNYLKEKNYLTISGKINDPYIETVNVSHFESNRSINYNNHAHVSGGYSVSEQMARDIENAFNNAENNFFITSTTAPLSSSQETLRREDLDAAIRLLNRRTPSSRFGF